MRIKLLVISFLIITIYSCTNKKKNISKTEIDTEDSISNYIGPGFLHHQQFSNKNFTSEKQWDSLNKIILNSKSASKYRVHNDFKTFGWHLYSKGSAYKSYNFSLLWGVSYFSYIVNPQTGSYKDIHQWKTTALVDSAKVNNCKVFLSVSNFGAKDNEVLLNNPKARKTLIDSLSSLIKYREADGVNIDFEGVSSKTRKVFNDFVIELSKELKTQNSDYMISIALYAVDYHKIFDIKLIDPYIDFYTLMGYDYYGGFSKHAGPVSPLISSEKWGSKSVEASVDYYINKGVTKKKLIVGFPYYGAKWQTQNNNVPGKVKKFIDHNLYNTIKEQISTKKYKVHYDTASYSSYLIDNQNKEIRQLWFDDSLSLSYKYDWIKNKKIAGVGVWALGYDHGYPELWELLANKFGQKDSL
ncbi:glycoside hydrolase family 18 protein [Aquimarina sp. 2201CG5-10]|uniref:glycoside hydrolase family 18 protein n=1 Tax=Aquimarina callyspongiae TaxID=3098150 RepID=UPI002AB49BC4|nr:glycoside hydrolase family 18 protein [Aquimarina sp. 2201CG5-10]MDY8134226.1 glycoside hydrolase family 18 protein [Aquimarina sp. 2201CG5-10]